MLNLYNKNGLIFWDEEEIERRNQFVHYLIIRLELILKPLNSAFEIIQVESPLIIPISLINPNYTLLDFFMLPETSGRGELALRPETTAGSYLAAIQLLNPHNERKVRLPLCVWQAGKSFRREQDQELKHMRLKEFYQLEFQILYSLSTGMDYAAALIPKLTKFVSFLIGPCRTEESDRLPSYSESTIDIIHNLTNLEVCSISKRTDFPEAKNLEVAFGLDRLVYCWQKQFEN